MKANNLYSDPVSELRRKYAGKPIEDAIRDAKEHQKKLLETKDNSHAEQLNHIDEMVHSVYSQSDIERYHQEVYNMKRGGEIIENYRRELEEMTNTQLAQELEEQKGFDFKEVFDELEDDPDETKREDYIDSLVDNYQRLLHSRGELATGGEIWNKFSGHASTIKSKAQKGYSQAERYVKDKIHDEKKKIALDVIAETGTRQGVSKKEDETVLGPAYDMVYDKYNKGGEIPNNYSGKTAEQIWNEWSPEQKDHFLSDHERVLEFEGNYHNVVQTKYNGLSDEIKTAITFHISKGQYATGGEIPSLPSSYFKTMNLSALPVKAQEYIQNEIITDNDIDLLQEGDEDYVSVRNLISETFPETFPRPKPIEPEPPAEPIKEEPKPLTTEDIQAALDGAEIQLEMVEGEEKQNLQDFVDGLKVMLESMMMSGGEVNTSFEQKIKKLAEAIKYFRPESTSAQRRERSGTMGTAISWNMIDSRLRSAMEKEGIDRSDYLIGFHKGLIGNNGHSGSIIPNAAKVDDLIMEHGGEVNKFDELYIHYGIGDVADRLNSLSLDELGELYVHYGIKDEGEFKEGKPAIVKKIIANVAIDALERDLVDIMKRGGEARSIKSDKQRKAKPEGYRFRGNKPSDYKRPSKADIKDGENVYYEGRKNRSDKNIKKKLKRGGRIPSALAREKKYTSEQEHEQNYRKNRVSKVKYYKTGKAKRGAEMPAGANKWREHLAQFRKANPELAMKDAMKGAAKTYSSTKASA